MPTPIFPYFVSTTVSLSPAVSVSDSLKAIFPGISMSNKCTFLCFAIKLPSGLNTQHVLYSLSFCLSGIEPPMTYTESSFARFDRAFAEGESSLSISSAYVGKLSLEYGQFHISGRTMMLAPLLAASFTALVALVMFSSLSAVTCNWHRASLKGSGSTLALLAMTLKFEGRKPAWMLPKVVREGENGLFLRGVFVRLLPIL
mmetsp:Transcript_13846/g.26599  ORF Transcript_13846/g.26599 Transcript_13846/m.26599 type:complete len:201 (-) Transcript_13846:119-721(-)